MNTKNNSNNKIDSNQKPMNKNTILSKIWAEFFTWDITDDLAVVIYEFILPFAIIMFLIIFII